MWKILLAAGIVATSSLVTPAPAHAQSDALLEGFQDPPESALPRTWWHWTASNVTESGITKDLEWMKRVGIGGIQLADVNAGGGQTVERKIVFGTPEWLHAVKHAAAEAKRLGLEMTIFASPGWSLAGGPWVKPEQAMKKLVWSETRVEGPRSFSGVLPQPPSVNGPIQNLAPGTPRPGAPRDPTYYGDNAVLAYPTPPDESEMAALRPTITTSGGAVDGAVLMDDDLNQTLTLHAPASGPAWIQYAFAQPYAARAFTISARGGIPFGRLLASDDGSDWRPLVTLPGAQQYRGGTVRTFDFPLTSARLYRLELTGAAFTPAGEMAQADPVPAKEYALTEAVLESGGRVHRWEEKAGFNFLFEYESAPTPELPATATIPKAGVIDLTSRMSPDGTLKWQVPPGKWTVLRMGYSLTGSKNRPAVPAALGYEVDKMNADYVRDYLHGYLDPIAKELGPLYGSALQYVLLDSWEAGIQNWTPRMPAEFQKRRGYDPTPYLPALAGRVVESAEVSDRFLWDFRRTIVDLYADEFYGAATNFLHTQGLKTYSEASGVSLEPLEDALLNKKQVDIPMGEFWMRSLHPREMYYQDVRGAASSAHIYGKPLVGAESFTGGGYESPYALKKVADYWLAQGINRLIFHTSAHQPLDTKPGNIMVGTHINRNITWAEQGAPFMKYLARSQYMLQQGKFVADLAYLLNEGAPSTMPFWGAGLQPAPPEGYDYDYFNADALLTRMSVAPDGRLVLPDGVSYRLLILPPTDRMTLPVLRKIRELVEGGATVLGPRPVAAPGLTGYPDSDQELSRIATAMWGDLDGVSRTRHVYGKGRVVWGLTPAQLLMELGVPADLEYGHSLDGGLAWLHRRTADAELYYLASQADQPDTLVARFRVAGKVPEIWRPDTGHAEPASYRIRDGRTTVWIPMSARDALFVVFRHPAADSSHTVAPPTRSVLARLTGGWDVAFPPGLGAPASIRLDTLTPWTESAVDGVRYFSGTATYTKTIEAPRSWFAQGAKLLLDLGDVGDLAAVRVNGTALGTVWKPPYAVDATGVLKPGANRIEVGVTNEWSNRLAGDRLAPDGKAILDAPPARGGFGPPRPISPSGLLGPVKVIRLQEAARAARPPAPPPAEVAGIPVNYDESKVGSYTLPDPLVMEDGTPVRTAPDWTKRRAEIVRLYEENQFGRAPGRPAAMSFDLFDPGTRALDGLATRKQVTIHLTGDPAGPSMELLVYTPASASGPVPLLLNISFSANSTVVDDPGIRRGLVWGRDGTRGPAPAGSSFGRMDIEPYLRNGIGFATVYYGDIEPDFIGGMAKGGIRMAYLQPGQSEPAPDEWGAIAAWAWGLSRALDYLETDPAVDAGRVALIGASRLGKTVLWAGARDPRFAMVIASVSGEGGAAISRRNYGETIAHLTAPTRYPYQFAANYGKFGDQVDQFPVDGNMLVSLIAPRPLLLQTGSTDGWSDPKGEFLAAVAAGPVYRLLGKDDLGATEMPRPDEPILHTLGFLEHEGGHGIAPQDYPVFLQFMKKYLLPAGNQR